MHLNLIDILCHFPRIFLELANCQYFSIVDLSDAFHQVVVSENSRKLLTINTHRGLFQYNRLPFGVKTAPGAFQQIMDQLISGLDGTSAYLDDILVASSNDSQHRQHLDNLFDRIREFGFKIKVTHTHFLQNNSAIWVIR